MEFSWPESVALMWLLLAHEGAAVKLLKEEIVTMDILRRQGETNQDIAVRHGITEGRALGPPSY